MAEAPDKLGGRLWACGLSHFETWQRIADWPRGGGNSDGDDTDSVGGGATARSRMLHLVLEDDVTFFKGWREEMARLVDTVLPKGWEVLYLDCMPTVDGWHFGPRLEAEPGGAQGSTRVALEGIQHTSVAVCSRLLAVAVEEHEHHTVCEYSVACSKSATTT
jgi:hypothetical protein